ncbi:hypothetical protein PFISCL1PPCAC_21567, partial [Pristionchus fissidentatus]
NIHLYSLSSWQFDFSRFPSRIFSEISSNPSSSIRPQSRLLFRLLPSVRSLPPSRHLFHLLQSFQSRPPSLLQSPPQSLGLLSYRSRPRLFPSVLLPYSARLRRRSRGRYRCHRVRFHLGPFPRGRMRLGRRRPQSGPSARAPAAAAPFRNRSSPPAVSPDHFRVSSVPYRSPRSTPHPS